jgi:hypothetical protein
MTTLSVLWNERASEIPGPPSLVPVRQDLYPTVPGSAGDSALHLPIKCICNKCRSRMPFGVHPRTLQVHKACDPKSRTLFMKVRAICAHPAMDQQCVAIPASLSRASLEKQFLDECRPSHLNQEGLAMCHRNPQHPWQLAVMGPS